jgi:uncharacterized protein YjiS (DUF1127 family)
MSAGMTRTRTWSQLTAGIDRTPASFRTRASALARRAWRTYWDRRARRATVLILRSLDERTLRDIGIAPSEIESCVWGGSDRLRRYCASWPWRSGG